ncbi:hypothetical protein BDN72DRAFT_905607 [Pluteus cervinus]|uniref:Uncharacterized protein n=1 Tax=Pluteus cervinus TaxID=181527 RepID=A0ACD3A2S5_9AGAR|nr:hypothetical protein BDN72DRAFT_905607 [Pluteus cervinus]
MLTQFSCNTTNSHLIFSYSDMPALIPNELLGLRSNLHALFDFIDNARGELGGLAQAIDDCDKHLEDVQEWTLNAMNKVETAITMAEALELYARDLPSEQVLAAYTAVAVECEKARVVYRNDSHFAAADPKVIGDIPNLKRFTLSEVFPDVHRN